MKPPYLFLFYHTGKEPKSSQQRARNKDSLRPPLTHKMKKTVSICPKSSRKKARKSSDGKLRVINCHAERLQMAIVVCILYKVIAVIFYWQQNF